MAKSAKKAARKPNAAFMKPVTPSAALAEVVGSKPIPRTEVTKKLWAYIKKNGLQDAKNKRMIKADAALKTVFGGKATVNMFEMTKLVSKHLKYIHARLAPAVVEADLEVRLRRSRRRSPLSSRRLWLPRSVYACRHRRSRARSRNSSSRVSAIMRAEP